MSAESPDSLRVCLAVPFFSNVGYLDAALRSLVAQTDRDWTAIVVDDASPEPGAEHVVAALGDHRIRYVRNERNLGISANFNRCLDLGGVDADVVAIFHADDALEPGYVAAVRMAHHRFATATCVVPRAAVIDARGAPGRTLADSVKWILSPRRLPFTLVGDRGLARLMRGLFFYCPAVSYRVELLGGFRFDERWRQAMDLDFFAHLLLQGGSIAVVPEHVYRHRRHDAAATAQNTRSLLRLDEEVAVCREVTNAAHKVGATRGARASRLRLTIRLNAFVEAGRSVAHGRLRTAVRAVRYGVSR